MPYFKLAYTKSVVAVFVSFIHETAEIRGYFKARMQYMRAGSPT